jgi:transposase InsO family protein
MATAKTMGIDDVRTAPHSPWQNAYVERFIGSIRRECLDHIMVLTAEGLRTILNSYVAYYTNWRTHLSLDKDSPQSRPVCLSTMGASSPFRKSADCIIGTSGAQHS